MTRSIPRFLFVGLCFIMLFHFPAIAGGPKTKEKNLNGFTYAIFSDESAPSKELMRDVRQQAQWDDDAAGDLGHLAYRLRFEKVDEIHAPEGKIPRYRMFAEGLPENKVYGLAIWEVGKELSFGERDVYVNSEGLVLNRRAKPDEEASSHLPDAEWYALPSSDSGVPTRYQLTSRDGQVLVYGTVVPNPVESLDGGCRLEARIAAPGAASVLLVADGFEAHTRIPFILESQGEISNVEVNADQNGHAVVAGFPIVAGKTKGTLKATAQGQSCLPSVEVPWDGGKRAAPTAPNAIATPAGQTNKQQ